jgi:hypothetical protein
MTPREWKESHRSMRSSGVRQGWITPKMIGKGYGFPVRGAPFIAKDEAVRALYPKTQLRLPWA